MHEVPPLPPGIEHDIRFLRDDRFGDSTWFHLLIDYRDERAVPPVSSQFAVDYQITGTEWDPAVARGEADTLVSDYRQRHQGVLLARARRELANTRSILIRIGNQLVRRRLPDENV